MARTANPNKEKIAALKTEIKDHNKTVRQGESAANKVAKLEARLAKLTGDAEPAASTKVKKSAKAVEKPAKKKVDAKAEKKAGKVVTTAKKRGRPAKASVDDEDD